MSVLDRFWNKIQPEPNSGCWLWTGAHDGRGYGQIWVDGRHRRAHRFSYELHKGPLSRDLVIDHLCKTPECVNPDHLDAVTQRENIKRGDNWNRSKNHCKNGHPFSGGNLYIRSDGNRDCRACIKERSARTNERRRRALRAAQEGKDDG